MKYTIQDANGGSILMVDGQASVCPFKPAHFLRGSGLAANQVNIQIITQPCNPACPHFNLNGETANLTCGGSIRELKIEKPSSLSRV